MSNTAEIQCPRSVSEEDRARAQIYQLLGVLLVDPPSSELLQGLASLQGDETPLGSACKNLAALATWDHQGLHVSVGGKNVMDPGL